MFRKLIFKVRIFAGKSRDSRTPIDIRVSRSGKQKTDNTQRETIYYAIIDLRKTCARVAVADKKVNRRKINVFWAD